MFCEDDLLPLSGLQHMTFCERRWALVQIEAVWEDNRFTAEGKALHERAHSGDIESRPGVLIRRTLPIHSLRLGLSGQADIVEFQPAQAEESGIVLNGRRGLWRPFPIEYKRTRDKGGSLAYQIQLCAQALCLEEMLSVQIGEGAVYDGAARRRQRVPFTEALRARVELLATRMRELFEAGLTPKAVLKAGCRSCSLKDRCFPESLEKGRPIQSYYRSCLAED